MTLSIKMKVVSCLLVLPVATITGFGRHQRSNTVCRRVPIRAHILRDARGFVGTAAAEGIRRRPLPVPALASANDGETKSSSSATSAAVVSDVRSWRVVMDVGREPLARMPFAWARQGVRMPLVVPTDLVRETTTTSKTRRFARPRSETVGFTGPDGYQESPVRGGAWSVSSSSDRGDGAATTTFRVSYTVEQELRKRDVVIEAGTELFLSTRAYTQTELDRLNREFYAAREALWSTGGDLNDALDRQQSSKKWNPKTERWEKRYPDENPFEMIKNQFSYWTQKNKQEKAKNQRPDPETLSDRGGRLPGVVDEDGNEENVYLVQQGVIRYGGENGPVCGVWTAQPITNVPTTLERRR